MSLPQNEVFTVSERLHTMVQAPATWPVQDGSMDSGKRTSGSSRSARSGMTTSVLPVTRAAITACRPPASHINGAGAVNTVRPAPSRASRPPPAVAATVTPKVCKPNVSRRSAGLAAAARVLTDSTCEKPSTAAVTRRSTPGSTSP